MPRESVRTDYTEDEIENLENKKCWCGKPRSEFEKEKRSTPEYKAREKEKRSTPEYKAREKERASTPEYKARLKEKRSTPNPRKTEYGEC